MIAFLKRNVTRFWYAKMALQSHGRFLYVSCLKICRLVTLQAEKKLLDALRSYLFADASDDLVVGQIADAGVSRTSRFRESREQALGDLLATSKEGTSRRASV